MALTVMTPEWNRIVEDILIYLIHARERNEAEMQELAQIDQMMIFNRWARSTGNAISNPELALWCTEYIQKMMNLPLRRLKKAAEIDGLRY